VAGRGAFQDVTELVTVREESHRLSRQLLGTLNSISDAFALVDGDWCVRFVNPQGEKLLGMSASELVGRNLWQAFPAAVGSPPARPSR
jgi:PAS domain-containing protein